MPLEHWTGARDWLDPRTIHYLLPLLALASSTGFLYWLHLLASTGAGPNIRTGARDWLDPQDCPLLASSTGNGFLYWLPLLASSTGFLYWLPLLTSSASSTHFLYSRRSDVSNCCSVCCTSRVALLFLFPLQPADLLKLRINLACNLRLSRSIPNLSKKLNRSI